MEIVRFAVAIAVAVAVAVASVEDQMYQQRYIYLINVR